MGPVDGWLLDVLLTDEAARALWRLQKDGSRRPRAERVELIRLLMKLEAESRNGTGNGHGGRESA
jgi:hypothetical protein